jgi:hypothetical protein
VLLRPPQALVPPPPPRLSVRGAQAPTSQEGPAPIAFLLLIFLRRRVLRHRRGRKFVLLTQPKLFVSPLPTLLASGPPLLLMRRPLLFPPLRRMRARSGSGCGRVGPRNVHGHPLLGRTRRQSRGSTWQKIKGKGEESTHQRTVGKHNERPEVIVAILDSLEVDGAPRPRGRVRRGETVVNQPSAPVPRGRPPHPSRRCRASSP